MNGSCAGGTGAFIDQMATLLKVTPAQLDELAAKSQRTYTIASRCGVFAKTDIQPLLNQGAKKEDVAASIFGAVVNQTIAGLAQGRRIQGKVLYLGGPLTFLPRLRESFDKTLKLTGICPENSLYYVALGAAWCGEGEMDLPEAIKTPGATGNTPSSRPSLKARRSTGPSPSATGATPSPAAGWRMWRAPSMWASTPAPPPSRRWSPMKGAGCSIPSTSPTPATPSP